MKRFTQPDFDPCKNCGERSHCEHITNPDFTILCGQAEMYKRLSAYEDMDLEPWEMERICDAYGRGMSLRTESALRLQMIREIPTDRLQDLVHEEAWVSALVYDLYRLLLAVDEGIRKKDLSILRPPSRPGAPENGIPFRRRLSELETEYEELLHSCCRYMERKRKDGGVKKEE